MLLEVLAARAANEPPTGAERVAGSRGAQQTGPESLNGSFSACGK